jgi:CspA family cold shock protein
MNFGARAMVQGTVKWFDAAKGYGFIQPNSGGKEMFVHISAVERAGLSTLNEGQTIEYETVPSRGIESADKLKVNVMLRKGHRAGLNRGSENKHQLRKSRKKNNKTTDLDIFLSEKNVALYKSLLDPQTGPSERKTILKLLAEDMSRLKEVHVEQAKQAA